MLVLGFTILFSIFWTNRFLTRFVLEKMEQPLHLLADGVNRIRDGNHGHHIAYAGKDEFAPACAAFNEMSGRLKSSVEQTQKQKENRKALLAGIPQNLRSPPTSIQAYGEGLLDGVVQTSEARRLDEWTAPLRKLSEIPWS